MGTPGRQGTVGRAENICKKIESKTSGKIENQDAKTRNRESGIEKWRKPNLKSMENQESYKRANMYANACKRVRM